MWVLMDQTLTLFSRSNITVSGQVREFPARVSVDSARYAPQAMKAVAVSLYMVLVNFVIRTHLWHT